MNFKIQIEGPSTSIEVYHGNEENRIEVFPSISSQIMSYYCHSDDTNVNTPCGIQAKIVGHKRRGLL